MPPVFSPAKINLYLAITGRRADGFHELVSVVAPLRFGDELTAEPVTTGGFTLECDDPAVPADGSNLILKAAALFAATTGWSGGAHFRLAKRIPMGAGLGGGSSNAVATLRVLNELSGGRATAAQLAAMAAQLGSDCALFLHGVPVVMRGRGERVEPLPSAAASRLAGRRVLVFKPSFGIGTAWAYGRMALRGVDYVATAKAETHLQTWLEGGAPAEALLANNMEPAAFEKYVALPLLLRKLRETSGVTARMSGSGSACYALLAESQPAAPLIELIRACWGEAAFVQETSLEGVPH